MGCEHVTVLYSVGKRKKDVKLNKHEVKCKRCGVTGVQVMLATAKVLIKHVLTLKVDQLHEFQTNRTMQI